MLRTSPDPGRPARRQPPTPAMVASRRSAHDAGSAPVSWLRPDVVRGSVDAGSPRDVLSLQRTVGNAAVDRLLRGSIGGRGLASPIQREAAQPVLRLGSRSPAVATLQTRLAAAGQPVTPDGVFGPATRAAVVAVQQAANLTPDGVVGPKTWAALDAGAAVPVASPGGTMPPTLLPKLAQVKVALQARAREAEIPVVAPSEEERPLVAPRPMRTILRDDDDSWLGGAVDAATSWAGEQVDAATSWAGEQVDAASNWVGEQAGAASNWVGEQADAASSWVENQAGAAADWAAQTGEAVGSWVEQQAEGVVDQATSAVETAAGELQQLGDGLRQRFPEQMAALDQVIADLGRGMRSDVNFGDIEKRIDDLLKDLDPSLIPTSEDGGTCTPGSTTITVETKTVRANGFTVQDAVDNVTVKLGGHVASVEPQFQPYTFCPPESDNKPVKEATVAVKEVKTVPSWAERGQMPQPAQQMWDNYLAQVDAHENRHIEIDKGKFTDMHKVAVGKLPNAAKAALDQKKLSADAPNAALDAREGCIRLNGGTGQTTLHPRTDCEAH